MGKRKAAGFVHNHTYNPRARESDERKIALLKNMEVNRLQKYVDKHTEEMRSYLPPEKRKKVKVDPLYHLKGAARVAQEFYRPPGYEPEVEPVDLFETHRGRLTELDIGKTLLASMLDLGESIVWRVPLSLLLIAPYRLRALPC